MADTAHAGSMGCIEAFLHIRDRGIAIGAGDQVVLTAGNLVVNGSSVTAGTNSVMYAS